MTIEVETLRELRRIDKLIIHVFDSSIYLASVVIDGVEQYLVDHSGQPVSTFRKLELLSLFDEVSVIETEVQNKSVYGQGIPVSGVRMNKGSPGPSV